MNLILNEDVFDYIQKIDDCSIDFILTDPPYNISRKSGFKSGVEKKFNSISLEFGYWDVEIDFDFLFKQFKRILRNGGSCFIFFDIWKSTQIKELCEEYDFKQLRVGQWLKTNPVPINSKINYLSNSSEYFFYFVKGKKATFNSYYDNAIYNYPICHGKERLKHPTQKPLALFKEIISKHTKENDIVLDCFSGTGTTAIACRELNRKFLCVEKDKEYYDISMSRLNNYDSNLIK